MLVQFLDEDATRRGGLVDGARARIVEGVDTVYALAFEAIAAGWSGLAALAVSRPETSYSATSWNARTISISPTPSFAHARLGRN